MAIFSKFNAFTVKYPIVRGILAYGSIWPVSNLIQQTLAGKKPESWDYVQMAQFGLFGALYMAPALYAWVRIASYIWPQTTFRAGLTKGVIEQFTFGPFAVSSFHFGMSTIEGKSMDESVAAVKEKFFPTWKVGIVYWSILQTINFTWVPERNRVPYVSCCSLIWGCFLSHMHHSHNKNQERDKHSSKSTVQ